MIDGQGPPQCICPEDCSDAYVPVCTSYWIEFNNTCEMHKFACAHQINMDILHFGKCNRKGKIVLPLFSEIDRKKNIQKDRHKQKDKERQTVFSENCFQIDRKKIDKKTDTNRKKRTERQT